MRVAIIIPVLNEAEHVGQAVKSAWRAGADEVVVADGGSTDDTPQIVKALDCRLVASPTGRALQQNAAARASDADVFLFQHADNWLAAGAVDQVRHSLENSAIQGGAFRQRIECGGFVYRLLERGNAFRARWRGLPYGDQGIFLRREIFYALGGFPEVPLMEDLILMQSFRRRAWPVLLPGPIHVSPRRWKTNGPVRQTLLNWRLTLAYRLGAPPGRLAKSYRRHDE